MCIRATHMGKKVVLISALLLGIVGALTGNTVTWASTRFGPDIEVQAWYRMRQTFQTDGTEHFDWVQWRNEGFVWLTYENVVKNGHFAVLPGIPTPFIQGASLSARYRARVDPVYYLREHY